MTDDKRCETCRFWEDADPTEPVKRLDDAGWCHRHAPMPLIVIGSHEGGRSSEQVILPLTRRYYWCGEWEPEDINPHEG